MRIDSADALPADDVFYFSVERADPRHALFVHEAENSRGLLYFKAALEASGQSAFEIDPATPDQTANLSPAKYAFVVLSDVGALPGGFREPVARVRARRRLGAGRPGPHVGGARARAGDRTIASKKRATRGGKASASRRRPGWTAPTHPF